LVLARSISATCSSSEVEADVQDERDATKRPFRCRVLRTQLCWEDVERPSLWRGVRRADVESLLVIAHGAGLAIDDGHLAEHLFWLRLLERVPVGSQRQPSR